MRQPFLESDLFFILAILWVITGALVGAVIGSQKNKTFDGLLWGTFFGPIGWLIEALSPAYFASHCPYCKAGVPNDATKCQHCGSDFPRVQYNGPPPRVIDTPQDSVTCPTCRRAWKVPGGLKAKMMCPKCHVVILDLSPQPPKTPPASTHIQRHSS